MTTPVRDIRRHDFFTIDNVVLDRDLSVYALVVYMVLCRYANQGSQTCRLLAQTLAKKAQCGKSTLSLAIKELEEKGLISVERSRESASCFTLLPVEGVIRNTDEGHPPDGGGSSATRIQNKTNTKLSTLRGTVQMIFNYYCQQVGKNPNLYTLTETRMQKGLLRLNECLVKTKGNQLDAHAMMNLCVDALAASEWHMGKNDQKRPFNDWSDHLFKSTDKLEKWLEEADRG